MVTTKTLLLKHYYRRQGISAISVLGYGLDMEQLKRLRLSGADSSSIFLCVFQSSLERYCSGSEFRLRFVVWLLHHPHSSFDSYFSLATVVLGPGPPLTEVSRALRARNAERVSKMSLGASGPRTPKSLQKVPEHSKNSLQTLSGDSPETSRTVPETFLRLFGVPGPEAPRDIFETLSAFRARKARETSVRGGLVPNRSIQKYYPRNFIFSVLRG